MFKGDRLYTKESDGTITRWYVDEWIGNRFSVSTVKNAKFRDYKKYFDATDVGKTIFLTRKEAKLYTGRTVTQ